MMFRKSVVLLCGVGLTLGLAGMAAAQEWPYYPAEQLPARGPGHYLAWYKLLACGILVLFWIRTTDWINRDTFEVGDNVGLPARVWNPIVVFGFLAAFLLAISMPLFPVGYALLVVAYVAPLITYIAIRNGRVTGEQKVLTRAHLKLWLAGLATGKKRKKTSDTLAAHEQGPPIQFTACGGTETENQAHLIMAKQSPGYVFMKELIADALARRATRVMLDYTKESVGVRYDVDGLWLDVEPRDRETGDVILAVMKKISALNMEERRVHQEGEFRMKLGSAKYHCQLVSQGTKVGERTILEFIPDKMPFKNLEELGMREKMRDELREFLGEPQGLVVFSALPLGGLQTMWNVGLTATDRYLRDFAAVEDKAHLFTHVENVEVFPFDGPAGQTPDSVLRPILLREPDVIVTPDFVNGATVDALCDYALTQKRLICAAIRAKDGIEALLRILALKPKQPEKFAATVTAVLNQRLVRLLCETCRQAYEPPEQLLQKLGIPKGRVEVLFREFQPPPPGTKKKRGEPEVCPDCGGLGYKGRTAVFEWIKISDDMRKALVERPRPEVLRELSHQAGNLTMQEEGVLLVARGATAINELQRVLKQ
jgi:type II secretory ATPase GspE/PulE/Tfp pilus assembly ATPase PilB-like protein